ncbi:MAG: TonB-dependent receptor [Cyclobacteriaceae bacterium]|nr:TonB-dependent receptor [Cyclobacteriaceae bacterium]
MIKQIFYVIMVIGLPCYAQTQTTVKGTVQGVNGQTLPFANVIGIEPKGQALIKGVMSDKDGTFVLTLEIQDTCLVQISYLGYKSHTFSIAPNTELNAGNIMLHEEISTLGAIEVRALKPLYEQKIDRTIVNVEGSIMSKGNSLLSALSKSPSVRVNMSSGEISLSGKQGILILIDGKPIRLERQDLLNYLSNLQADNIATIELITSPPANYDAQGAGVINITTIKKKDGLLGQVSPSFGFSKRPKYGNGLNLSYQKNKFYSYALINTTLNYDLENVTITTVSETLAKSSDLTIARKPKTALYTGELGMEYQLTEKSTIGAMVSLLQSDWFMNANAKSVIINENGQSNLSTHSYEENQLNRKLYNLNFRHKFNANQSMNIDVDHIDFTRKNPTIYTVTDQNTSQTSRFLSSATTPVNVSTIKTDWGLLISEKVKLDFGLKTAFSKFTNNVTVANEQNSSWIDDPAFKNEFKLNEDIYAGYVSADYKPNTKWNLKAGIRYEHYNLKLTSATEGQIIGRYVGNLFPSFFATYQLEKESSINFSIVNRIQRPGFLILAPYFYFFDQNTLTTGNPSILPARVNQVQVGYSFPNFNLSLQYNTEQAPILDFQPIINPSLLLFEIKPFQGIMNHNFNMNLNYTIEPSKWWTARINFIGYRNNQKFNVGSVAYQRNIFGYDATTTQTFSFRKVADIEITAGYYSANIYGTLDIIARRQVDAGIRKKLKSGTVVTFSVSDIFNTGTQWPNRSNLTQSDLNYYFNFDAEGPVFRWSLNIPIGSAKTTKEKRETGSADELNRIR